MSIEPEASSQPTSAERIAQTSTIVVAALVIAGIVLIWVGQLVLLTANLDRTETVREAYRNSLIISGVGAMISSSALIGGALTMKNFDKFVRLGMIIAAAFIVVRVLALGIMYPFGYI